MMLIEAACASTSARKLAARFHRRPAFLALGFGSR